jgi:glycosyltransferase involved in cell wall biosynthesis
MNILLVANGFPPSAFGGVEIYTLGLARQLARVGHAVKIFCRESNHKLRDYQRVEEEVDGVNVVRVINDFKGIDQFSQTFADERMDAIFSDVLREFGPDVVHFNHLIALSVGLPSVAEGQRIPCVLTLHDYWPLCHRVTLLDWRKRRCPGPSQGGDCYRCVVGPEKRKHLMRAGLEWARKLLKPGHRQQLRSWLRRDAGEIIALRATRGDFDLRLRAFMNNVLLVKHVLAPSQFVRQIYELNGYPRGLIRVLPLGIDLPEGKGSKASDSSILHVGFIGTVLPSKGAHVLIKALKQVPGKRLSLAIYGRLDADPAYTRRLRRLAASDSRVRLMGAFAPTERAKVLGGLDLVVLPSLVPETFSMVAREALVMGVPVITSRIGALPEIVKDGVNGFLTPPGDARAIANVLQRILQTPDLLNELQLPGPVPIQSIEEHVSELVALYADAAIGKAAPRGR